MGFSRHKMSAKACQDLQPQMDEGVTLESCDAAVEEAMDVQLPGDEDEDLSSHHFGTVKGGGSSVDSTKERKPGKNSLKFRYSQYTTFCDPSKLQIDNEIVFCLTLTFFKQLTITADFNFHIQLCSFGLFQVSMNSGSPALASSSTFWVLNFFCTMQTTLHHLHFFFVLALAEDKLTSLIDLQSSDGHFRWGEILTVCTKQNKDELTTKRPSFAGNDDLWLTAIAIALLEAMEKDLDLWELVVQKARKFLAKHLTLEEVQKLIEAAKKI